MADFDKIIDVIINVYCPLLEVGKASMIKADIELMDDEFAVDSFLQFSLLDGINVADDLLDRIETEVRADWDPDLVERTLGWIVMHREKNLIST